MKEDSRMQSRVALEDTRRPSASGTNGAAFPPLSSRRRGSYELGWHTIPTVSNRHGFGNRFACRYPKHLCFHAGSEYLSKFEHSTPVCCRFAQKLSKSVVHSTGAAALQHLVLYSEHTEASSRLLVYVSNGLGFAPWNIFEPSVSIE